MAETHRDDIAKLEALYAENPEGRVFIHLAEAYRRAGNLDRALEVVQDGISRYPEDSSAHVVLGRVLEDRQQDDEAGDAFRRVLELDAHNLVALRGLGDLEFRAGHHKAALDYFERLAEIEPPDGELEALMEALREGPAVMSDPLQQWDAVELADPADAASRPEAVDFAGGTLGHDGASEPTTPSEPTPEWTPAEAMADEATPQAPAAEAPSADREEPEVVPLEGLQPQEGLQGAEAAGTVESLEVTERDFSETAADDGEPAQVGGLEGLQTVDSIAASASTPEGDGRTAGEEEEAEPPEATQPVFTETMAQVYARQGLYERAADVYRELLRQRPGDAALETRLAEMQELQAGADAGMEGMMEQAPGEPFPFLDEAPTAKSTADVVEFPEEPWEPEDAEAPQPPQTHEAAEPPAEAEPPEAHDSVQEPASASGVEPATGQAPEPWQPEYEEGGGPPERGQEEVAEPWADEATERAAEDVEAMWTGAAGAAGTEETPYSWTEPAEPAPAVEGSGEAIRSYLLRLAGWAARGPLAPAPDASASESAVAEPEALAEPSVERAAGAEPANGGAAREEAGQQAASDDDLDMFRAWLESLKR